MFWLKKMIMDFDIHVLFIISNNFSIFVQIPADIDSFKSILKALN